MLNMIIPITIFVGSNNPGADSLHIFIIRSVLLFIAVISTVSLFIFAYSSTCLCRSAHYSYSKLNSIIAKQNPNTQLIPLDCKNKIISLIEKLAGPPIAVYCLDLFPLTSYEFYLFVCNLISNFILLLRNLWKI